MIINATNLSNHQQYLPETSLITIKNFSNVGSHKNDENFETANFSLSNDFNETELNLISPFNDIGIITIASFIFPMVIIGVVSNFITIVTISQTKLDKSIFDLFIVSLSISDLLSALVSPLFFYQMTWGYKNWNLPAIMCKVYWTGDLITSITTSLHIFVFCGLRLLSIAKPHSISCIKLNHIKVSILVLWTISTLTGGFTYGYWTGVIDEDERRLFPPDHPHCSTNFEWVIPFKKFSTVYGATIFYFFPFIAVIVMSIGIVWCMKVQRRKRRNALKTRGTPISQAERNREKKENLAVIQLALIVLSYLLGYIPGAASFMLVFKISGAEKRWWVFVFCYICMRFTECLNPIFYNLCSTKIRKESMKLLRKVFPCK